MFPREFGEFAAEVAVAGGLLVDGAEQIEALRDVVGAQVEHFTHGLGEHFVRREDTSTDTGSATPMQYAICTSQRGAKPAATTFLAT